MPKITIGCPRESNLRPQKMWLVNLTHYHCTTETMSVTFLRIGYCSPNFIVILDKLKMAVSRSDRRLTQIASTIL